MNKTALGDLSQFYGTVNYHRFTPFLVLTDGVKHLIDNADCHWLIDIIASFQGMIKKDAALQDIQFWSLLPYPKEGKPEIKSVGKVWSHIKVAKGARPMAYVVCNRDSGDTAIVQEIDTTDFPFDIVPEAKIWLEPTMLGNRLTMVAMLPTEH